MTVRPPRRTAPTSLPAPAGGAAPQFGCPKCHGRKIRELWWDLWFSDVKTWHPDGTPNEYLGPDDVPAGEAPSGSCGTTHRAGFTCEDCGEEFARPARLDGTPPEDEVGPPGHLDGAPPEAEAGPLGRLAFPNALR